MLLLLVVLFLPTGYYTIILDVYDILTLHLKERFSKINEHEMPLAWGCSRHTQPILPKLGGIFCLFTTGPSKRLDAFFQYVKYIAQTGPKQPLASCVSCSLILLNRSFKWSVYLLTWELYDTYDVLFYRETNHAKVIHSIHMLFVIMRLSCSILSIIIHIWQWMMDILAVFGLLSYHQWVAVKNEWGSSSTAMKNEAHLL